MFKLNNVWNLKFSSKSLFYLVEDFGGNDTQKSNEKFTGMNFSCKKIFFQVKMKKIFILTWENFLKWMSVRMFLKEYLEKIFAYRIY